MSARTEWQFVFTGWLLFTGSAIFYTVASIVSGDWMGIAGSVLFLLACLVFLVPVWTLRPPRE